MHYRGVLDTMHKGMGYVLIAEKHGFLGHQSPLPEM